MRCAAHPRQPIEPSTRSHEPDGLSIIQVLTERSDHRLATDWIKVNSLTVEQNGRYNLDQEIDNQRHSIDLEDDEDEAKLMRYKKMR